MVENTGSFHDQLPPHFINNSETSALGAANPDVIDTWEFVRDAHVGSLNSIDWLNGTGELEDQHRFATTRLEGYELDTVTLPDPVSGTVTAYISHDDSGRISDINHPQGTVVDFNALDRLVGTDAGHLLYDARGRLVYDGTYLVWDGDQMIGSFYDDTEAEWVAIWGGSLDQLMEVQTEGQVLVPLTDFRNSVVGVWSESTRMSAVAQYDTHGLQNV